jgi:hypothetical protein
LSFKRIALLSAGIVSVLLGGLWFLQAAGILHLQPILCLAACGPITGPSPLWEAIGAGTAIIGIALIVAGRRHGNPN